MKEYKYTVQKEEQGDSYNFNAPLLGSTGYHVDLYEEREDKVYLVDRVRIIDINDIESTVSCISIIKELTE